MQGGHCYKGLRHGVQGWGRVGRVGRAARLYRVSGSIADTRPGSATHNGNTGRQEAAREARTLRGREAGMQGGRVAWSHGGRNGGIEVCS